MAPEYDHEPDGLPIDPTDSASADEHAVAEDDAAELPLDVAAVRADDELIDMLSRSNTVRDSDSDPVDQELRELLLAWRVEVSADPIPELIATDAAAQTIVAAANRLAVRKRRRRFVTPLSAAAAALAVALTGVGLAAKDARPGDALWGVTQVLYGDHARSIEAAQAARASLASAQVALKDGRVDEAKAALERAGVKLGSVSTEDGKDDLAALRSSLVHKLKQQPAQPAPTESSAPPPVVSQSPSTPPTGTSPTEPPSTSPSPPSSTSPPETTGPPSSTTSTSSSDGTSGDDGSAGLNSPRGFGIPRHGDAG